ncbi:hypothetical protein R3P38DRAFT_2785647 [Favolaschia claudopus]|uniref:Uncharacterized protein n=1 Tax=Favolaschia claudopus TaxID=2862362 RepID=A0AAW0AV02_9AGAR
MGEIADRPAMDVILNSVGAFIERISEHYRNPHWEVPRARQHEFLLPPGFRVPRESARQLPDFELWDNKGIRDAPLEAWLQIASSAPPALTSEPSPQRVRPPGRRARATSSSRAGTPLGGPPLTSGAEGGFEPEFSKRKRADEEVVAPSSKGLAGNKAEDKVEVLPDLPHKRAKTRVHGDQRQGSGSPVVRSRWREH